MLDDLNTPLTSTAAWQNHLSYGDIVSYEFPLAEEQNAGRPTPRPCLVLDIEEIGSQRHALLAYGTRSDRRSTVPYVIHVRRQAEYLSAGLGEPTQFVGSRRLLVPLTHHGFETRRLLGSPVLGRLEGAPFADMQAVRGRLHAETDIAADRRSRRQRWLRRDRDFIVEYRKPRALAARRGGAA